jgi:hypothetical protein
MTKTTNAIALSILAIGSGIVAACATPQVGTPARDRMNQESATVNRSNDDPSYYPLEKVSHGLLRLIARINSPEDVTVKNFREAMQLPEVLGKNQHIWDLNVDKGSISFNSDVPETEWTYSLSLSADGPHKQPPGITLRFDHPKNDNTHEAEKTSICTMDYEAYKQALLAQGFDIPSFEPSEFSYFTKGGMSYSFTRGNVAVTIYTEREGADTDAKKNRACPVIIEVVVYSPEQLQGSD